MFRLPCMFCIRGSYILLIFSWLPIWCWVYLCFFMQAFQSFFYFFGFSHFYFRAEFPLAFHVGFFCFDFLFRGSCFAGFLELFFVVFHFISFFLYYMVVGSSSLVCSDFSYSHCILHYAFNFLFGFLVVVCFYSVV